MGLPVKRYYAIECDSDFENVEGIHLVDNIFSLSSEKIREMLPVHLVVVGPSWPETQVKQDLSDVAIKGKFLVQGLY